MGMVGEQWSSSRFHPRFTSPEYGWAPKSRRFVLLTLFGDSLAATCSRLKLADDLAAHDHRFFYCIGLPDVLGDLNNHHIASRTKPR
jgi:hypothetical protein